MPAVQQLEWVNQNALRNYPFQEDMQRIPMDPSGNPLGAAALPNYVLVDMIFTIPGAADLQLYLGQMAYVGSLLTFVFKAVGSDETVTSVTVDRLTHETGQAYSMAGTGDWYDARGWLTVGDLSRIVRDLPEGLYTYASTQTLLETRCCRPAIRGIRSLRIENAGNVSELITGHVKILAGENIRLEYDAALNGFWIHAEPNAGYKEQCACEAQSQQNIVRTINGIPVEDVTIEGDGECVEVTTSGNTITISDKCSKPCCGCPELDLLTESIKIIDTSLTKLTSYADKLNERIQTFVTNFVMTV